MLRLLLIFGCLAAPAFGWSRHELITRAAVAKQTTGRTVVATPLAALLARWGETEQAFQQRIRIHGAYRFTFHAGEAAGRPIALSEVLSTYSDEPDWKMDQELFEAGEFPDLWRPEYAMMGGRRGTPSQAFRHMFWPSWSWHHPFGTFHLPFGRLLRDLGEAPLRFGLFLTLSRRAKASGDGYWAARFLANAIHYLEDVASPFHSAQTPTKRFLTMPFTDPNGEGRHEFVRAVTNVISWYHFAYEDYLARVMARGPGDADAKSLYAALAEGDDGIHYGRTEAIVRVMADRSLALAAPAARASIAFFPRIPVKFSELEPKKLQDETWWRGVMAQSGAARHTFFRVATALFAPVGEAVRQVVRGELK